MYDEIMPNTEHTATATAHHPILTTSYIILTQNALYVNFKLSTMYPQSDVTNKPSIGFDTTLFNSDADASNPYTLFLKLVKLLLKIIFLAYKLLISS